MKLRLLTLALLSGLLGISITALETKPAQAACPKPKIESFISTMNTLDNLRINDFKAKRDAKSPCWIDWSSDGCTSSPDSGKNYHFLKSCQRHDFGWRNLKRAEAWYRKDIWRTSNKTVADTSFKRDMTNHCHARKESEIDKCLEMRTKYYNYVAQMSPNTSGKSGTAYKIR